MLADYGFFGLTDGGVCVFAYPKYNTQQIFDGVFGVFYVAVMLSYVYQTRNASGDGTVCGMAYICKLLGM